jgi:hypothetical protein
LLSLGKARSWRGIKKMGFSSFIAQESIARQYDKKELERDMLSLDQLS